MTVALVYSPDMAEYEFPDGHPLRPERFSLTVSLIGAWGLLGSDSDTVLLEPDPASHADLLLAHSAAFVEHVTAASAGIGGGDVRFGTGEGDTPAFPGMHQAAALVAGGTELALDTVLSGRAARAFAPAGGLHHAKFGRAAGFCVYNDCAIAIAKATLTHPGSRIAYVDIDAHHGDGVQAAFYDRSDVLTVSVHESGQYLFPGTGSVSEMGEGPGAGSCINVPLPPDAGDDAYARVLERVVVPALHAFGPDAIVAQIGADTHRDDPLTHLDLSIEGYVHCVRTLVSAADDICGGHIVATGGGGYQPFSVVPRMWASAFAVLAGADIPEEVPAEWVDGAVRAGGTRVSRATFDDRESDVSETLAEDVARRVERVIDAVTASSPLLEGAQPNRHQRCVKAPRDASADGGVVAL